VKLAAAILIDGVIDASWLFVVAVGLTLVFGVPNILNFAHGSQFAVGAYAAASAVGWYYGGDTGPWYYGGDIGPPFFGYLLMLGAAMVLPPCTSSRVGGSLRWIPVSHYGSAIGRTICR